MPALISFRAGRAERRGTTSWVDPQPGRGLVSVEQSNDDGLLHFIYKDLESNNVVDDLILFPGDATFAPVSNARRVYVLRFTSSSARHFYWMQDVADDQDSRRASRVNALIDDPSASEDTSSSQSQDTDMSSSAPAASSSQPAPSSSSSPSDSNPAPSSSLSSASNITQEQMAQLQALIQRSGQSAGSSALNYGAPTVSLADILSPSRLLSLLNSNPSIAESLYAYLPPASDTVPHNLETLKAVFTSPEVRKSARGLDQALSTGALGPLAYGLGLKEDETFGVESYLKGVQRLGDEEKSKSGAESGNAMQTD